MIHTPPYNDVIPFLLHPVRLTGSRMFGVHTATSDWDWFSSWCPGKDRLQRDGWREVNNYGPRDGFWIFQRNNENLIIAMHQSAGLAWRNAERHCMIERPRSKPRRRVIFDHYLYGMPLNRSTPLPQRCRKLWFRWDRKVIGLPDTFCDVRNAA